MDYAAICIIKRDGKQENFSMQKISNAIGKAFTATGLENDTNSSVVHLSVI